MGLAMSTYECMQCLAVHDDSHSIGHRTRYAKPTSNALHHMHEPPKGQIHPAYMHVHMHACLHLFVHIANLLHMQ